MQFNSTKTQTLDCNLAKGHSEECANKGAWLVVDRQRIWRDHLVYVSAIIPHICYILLKLCHHVIEPYFTTVYHAMSTYMWAKVCFSGHTRLHVIRSSNYNNERRG